MLVRFTPKVFFLFGLIVHVSFLLGVLDTYFTSPIDTGLVSHHSAAPAIAKRVVLIVSDGLRAEGMFKYENHTTYLTNIRKTRGSWGVCHTQVPTESRPGHVAILAGIYEDPSAIFKGWQENSVDFDSVIKQSSSAYSWGSPDIVNIFSKDLKHVHTDSYNSAMEDFSGVVPTKYLDEWVFKRVHQMFANITDGKSNCDSICDTGNIFFLHLLGLDSAGHIHKPNSKQYVENILVVDNGIASIEKAFSDFFHDDDTTYVFTADHGMTDWGSHGSGSLYETEVPFITWGKGITGNPERHDIKQADLAPLLATLIGVNIPINSIGKLPYSVLNVTHQQLAGALLSNAKQMAEQFVRKDHDSSKNLIYFPFKKLSVVDLQRLIKTLDYDFSRTHYELVVSQSMDLISLSIEGIKYYQYYYQIPTLVCLSMSFFGWFIFVALYINAPMNHIAKSDNTKLVLKLVYFLLLCSFGLLVLYGASPKYYIYLLFCCFIIYIVNKQYVRYKYNFDWKTMKYAPFFLVYMEILVLGFFNRQYLVLAVFIIVNWIYFGLNNVPKKLFVKWVFTASTVCIFLFVPTDKTFCYASFFVTSIVWIFVHYSMLAYNYLHRNLYIFLIATINSAIIATFFDYGYGVPLVLQFVSWLVFVSSFILILISPNKILIRLSTIASSLMSIYLLMTMYIEGIFSIVFVMMMFTWLDIENYANGSSTYKLQIANFSAIQSRSCVTIDDYRRAVFFLTFVLIAFFGTGNIASLSSFDPVAVRAFITTFSPFSMALMILLKITIPFFICTCTFVAVINISRTPVIKMFAILLMLCDVMVFNFQFLIKNEGSWLEIGTSLSHFIIAEVMTLILIVFYQLAIYLTRCTPKWIAKV